MYIKWKRACIIDPRQLDNEKARERYRKPMNRSSLIRTSIETYGEGHPQGKVVITVEHNVRVGD